MSEEQAAAVDQRAVPLVRRLLADPGVLPSATTLRFAVLVAMLVASTGSIYGYIGLQLATQSATPCQSAIGPVTSSPLSAPAAAIILQCTAPFTATIAVWTLAGIALVAFATFLSYLITPWWAIHVTRPWLPRKRRQVPWVRPWWTPGPPQRLLLLREDRPDQRAMAERVRQLAEQSQLAEPPCLLDPYAGIAAWAFGRQRRGFLRLGLDLGRVLREAPPVFDGIVLHELAHLRNADNRPTFVTYAAWRVFLLLALVPYVITFTVPGLLRDPFSRHALAVRLSLPDGHQLAAVATLTVLTYLTRNAVLRVRETHADASAALVDRSAMRAAIEDFLARTDRTKRQVPDFLALHPAPRTRLADLDDPGSLCRPGGMAVFSAGIAAALIATNLVFTLWVGSLSTSLDNGWFRRLVAGALANRDGPIFLLQTIVYGPVIALTLPLMVGFACAVMWRAQLGALDGKRRPAVARHAVALALGYLVGEPMSMIYANAGTWGVFDSSGAWEAADLAASALALCVIAAVIFQWAAESAAVWIPVTIGSLRLQCTLATVFGTLGAAPVFLLWLIVHNNPNITTISHPMVDHRVASWPLIGWAVTSYLPLTTLCVVPGVVALVAIPCLYTVVGTTRRTPRRAPRWLPVDLRDATALDALRGLRPRSRTRTALLTGLGLAVAGPVLALGFAIGLRSAVGGGTVHREGGYAGLIYVTTIGSWIMLAVCGIAAFLVARSALGTRLSAALLTVLVGTALGSPLLTMTVVVGECGTTALTCARQGEDFGTIYGDLGTAVPMQGAILVIFILIFVRAGSVAMRHRKPFTLIAADLDPHSLDGGESDALAARAGRTSVLAATYLLITVGAYCCARYYLKL